MDHLHIDLESRSPVDLPTCGLDRYAKDKSTQILMIGYAVNDDDVQLWQAHEGEMPKSLRRSLLDSRLKKVAWNASFERNLLGFTLGIDVPLCSWEDTMVKARYASLPGHLQDASDALKLGSEGKSRDGKELIRLFCKPIPGGDPNQLMLVFSDEIEDPVSYHDWNTDPAAWERFGAYCKQDVAAERVIDRKLEVFGFPIEEQFAWVVDQTINERGIYVDSGLVHGALQVANNTRIAAIQRMKDITGYANPQSVKQLMAWLDTQGYDYESLGKFFVNRALDGQCQLTAAAREVLLLRQETGKASVRKLNPLTQTVSSDNRLRNQFTFLGAARTGRWSGKGGHGASVQLQNLPRPIPEVEKNTDLAISLIRNLDISGLKAFDAKPMEVVASTLRAAFCAAPGKKLIVADLSAVENRVLGWIAQCPGILNVFKEGKDPYKAFAVFLFRVAYEEVTKEQRQWAKPPVLGCGYGLSGGEIKIDADGNLFKTGLMRYAEAMHIDLDQELAHKAVKIFRQTYPEVPRFWKKMIRAAVAAIRSGHEVPVNNLIAFDMKGPALRMILPSGRCLHYLNPQVEEKVLQGEHGDYTVENIWFDGKEQGKPTWGRIVTGGTKLTENCDQAISRDLLLHGIMRAEAMGLPVVGHVHDEIIAETEVDSFFMVEDLEGVMKSLPAWATGLPMDAAGWEGSYYHK